MISVNCGLVITASASIWGFYDGQHSHGAGASAMSLGQVLRSHRLAVVALLAMLTVVGGYRDSALARGSHQRAQKQVARSADFGPRYADIVVDANSGEVLHESKPDDPRHPASLTKIMTLYLLFEQIEAGKLKLDSPLTVSARAAGQHPVKLGLKADQTLAVEDAIKALVTKSANDAAVVVAEAIGGTEEEFARLMTRKARALGMAHTTYANASGLPDDEQITTAREQAILGRAIQDRFPDYYRYFSTPSFQYLGREMRNHNGLLGQMNGIDGIKTGYTDASGYNLVASLRRNDRHLVAVVLGGSSNGARDTRMRQLLEEHVVQASTQRIAPKIMEAAVPDDSEDYVPVRTIKAAVSAIPLPIPRVAPSAVAPTLASVKTEQALAPKHVAMTKRQGHRARAAAR
jgi:D-alanyl-D-alanine carboxypeptidase